MKRPRRVAAEEGGGDPENLTQTAQSAPPSRPQSVCRPPIYNGSMHKAKVREAQPERSESVEPELGCEVCHQPSKDDEMLVCDSCNRGFHTFCLTPRLHYVPADLWYCGDCGGESQRTGKVADVTLDSLLLKHLEGEPFPEWVDSKSAKRVRKRAKNYFLSSNQLYRKATGLFKERPVCPKHDREQVIKQTHELGHFGVHRTAAMVAQEHYWGGIVQDCADYIKNCPQCRLDEARFSQPPQTQSMPVNDQSFHRVGIDLLGPLPVTDRGNKYVVVAIDYLTKWPEVRAIPDKKASTVSEFFFESIIARHGCPREVVSDNGGEFLAEFDELLQKWKIDHRFTAPNHPQANGLVERFNGTLSVALRKTAASCINNWDKEIPAVLLGYRASIQASTKYPPFFMLYARHPVLSPRYDSSEVNLEAHTDEEAANMLLQIKADTIKTTAAAAVTNIEKAQAKQQRDYKAKRKYVEPTKLKPKDFVVIKASSRKGKLDPKAQPDVFQLVDFTTGEKNAAIIRDAAEPPKKWVENISNLALYVAVQGEESDPGNGQGQAA